jgi:hypothetical protein
MPTENKSAEPFQREDRYIVIKRSDVDTFWRDDVREQFMAALERLNEHHVRTPQRQFLVIESDWPEYEAAWHMIERRVNGVAGRLPEVVAVINEEGEHFKETVVEHRPGIDGLPVGTELVDRAHVNRLQAERDALQLRLNAADQRIDELTQRQSEPVAWSYKFGGEQRFYPTDPRGPEAGAASHYITDVEPLYHHSAEQPELVSVVLDERVMAKPNRSPFTQQQPD